jgi:hypothetical protein
MNDEELLRGLKDAARRHPEPEPEAPDLSAPLGPAFEARMVEQLARRGAPSAPAPAPAPAPKPRSKVVWLFAPVAAAAAVAALWLAWPGSSPTAPLPEYAMEVRGGVDSERGAPQAPRTGVSARPGDTLSIVLRPAIDVGQPIEAHLFASVAASASPPTALREVPVTLRVSASGSVELRVKVADLAPASEPEVFTRIVLLRPGLDPVGIARSAAPELAGARVFLLDVRIVR